MRCTCKSYLLHVAVLFRAIGLGCIASWKRIFRVSRNLQTMNSPTPTPFLDAHQARQRLFATLLENYLGSRGAARRCHRLAYLEQKRRDKEASDAAWARIRELSEAGGRYSSAVFNRVAPSDPASDRGNLIGESV